MDATPGAQCVCGFTIRAAAPNDFRPQHPAERTLRVTLDCDVRATLAAIPLDKPPVTYDGPRAQRDSSELFSAALPWLKSGAAVLDLGCGPRDQFTPLNHLGARYVGIDYDSPNADLLADAHAIPFRAGTFDAVLSYAVFEHLYNPQLAAVEAARVLKPGGVFFGFVSQGEPYHESFFHHTSLGVLEILRVARLKPLRLWAAYDTLHALAVMGRYPKPQRMLIEAIYRLGEMFPVLAPRKHFRWSVREKQVDELHRASSIAFVAQRT